jgi:SAM-dependent methyltransferase
MNVTNKSNLVEQTFWDTSYDGVKLQPPAPHNQAQPWYEKHIPGGPGSCIEIGCFPGQFLAAFGAMGYEINGIDMTPRTETDMLPWLKTLGYPIGEVFQGDFFAYKTDRKFDLVASFGFIEHFPDWDEVLQRHMDLVAPGGYLVISVPNFRGIVQRTLHYLLDRENYKRHVIDAMAPEKWQRQLKRDGFDILEAGYFSQFSFWTEEDGQNMLQRGAAKVVRYMTPTLARILPKNQPSYAPYCGVVAQRQA